MVYDVADINALKANLARWRDEVASLPHCFRLFFNFLFDYLKEDKTVLPLDEAKLVWQLVGMEKRWPMLPQFIAFLDNRNAAPAGVRVTLTRDSWRQILQFAETFPTNFDKADAEDSAWPLLYDDFIEWSRSKKK